MNGSRSVTRRAWISSMLVLGCGFAVAGCGAGNAGPTERTDAQKAEEAARRKETEDAFKDFQKQQKAKKH